MNSEKPTADGCTIRHAAPGDIPAIVGIFDRARAYMRSKGNLSQWTGGYPSAATALADMEAGNCYVGLDSAGAVRFVFTLIFGDDPTYGVVYGGSWTDSSPYATLHRVASDGSVRGMLRRCVDFALQTIPHLRIDTHRDNRPMLKAIADCRFTRCGVILLADGSPREAFELCAADESKDNNR